MTVVPSRPRRSSGGLPSSLVPPAGALRSRRFRRLSRQEALSLLSPTDRELLSFLTEHRVATTHQVQTILDLSERTARYRLERLKLLGMAGAVRPYAESGSEPNHWYPAKTADAWARGAPVPQGGERERPNESFVRHAAAVTGVYVAMVRLGPTLGFSVSSSAREIEAKEEFRFEGRDTCIIPDLAVVLSWDDASYRAFCEVDLGTMSLPRLSRKLTTYAAYVEEEAWREHHPFPPSLLVLTTTRKRAEAVVRAWERFLHPGSRRRAPRFPKARSIAVGASDTVHTPESAIAEAVWIAPEGIDGLSLRDLLDPPWRKWREGVARRRAEREHREAIERRIWDAPPERRRDMLREGEVDFFPRGGWWSYHGSERQKTVAHLLAGEGSMGEAERKAFLTFCDRRSDIRGERLVRASRYDYADFTDVEGAALDELHDEYLLRQRHAVAKLFALHPGSPSVAEAVAALDAGKLLTTTKERELPDEVERDLRIIDRLRGRNAEYLAWRDQEARRYRRGAGIVRGLFFNRAEAAASIDRSYVRLCPECRHVLASVPPPEDVFGRQESPTVLCPFDRDHKLIGLAAAINQGLVEEDGEGFWRPCRPDVPTWAQQLSPFPPSIEEERLP